MIGGEVDVLSPIRGRQTVLDAALILADGNQLSRSDVADGVAHTTHPIGEDFLREDVEVVNLERIVADIGATLLEFDFLGEGNGSLNCADREIPGRSQRGAIWVTLIQPLIPG